MKIGDLVQNLNSESKMPGIIIDIEVRPLEGGSSGGTFETPVVLWADGRHGWIMPNMVKKVNETR
tara:strand:+ start:298 stop:492 length:195 start_codon:yes stop_codon:yes gene_type:complete